MNYRAIVERVIHGFRLPQDKDAAFAACLDYARNDLVYPENNEFLQLACERLGQPLTQLTVLDSISWDASSDVRVVVTEDDRVEIEADEHGLRKLARLFSTMADASEEEITDLEPETELVGDSFPLAVVKVDKTKFILPSDAEVTAERFTSPVRPEEVFAVQFLGPLPEDLAITVGKIYRVRGLAPNPVTGEQDFEPLPEPSEHHTFLLRDDAGVPVNVVLDLYDENVNFITREEVSELLEED